MYQLAANAFICTRPIWYRHGSSVIHFLSVSINWTAGAGGLQPLLACISTVFTSDAESMSLGQINSRLDTFISIYLSTALASIIRPFGAVRWRWLTDGLTNGRTGSQSIISDAMWDDRYREWTVEMTGVKIDLLRASNCICSWLKRNRSSTNIIYLNIGIVYCETV